MTSQALDQDYAHDHDAYRQLASVKHETSGLADAMRAQSRYLATVGHDLRQPLHALSLFVAELRNAGLPAAQSGLLEHMEAALRMGHGLVDGILSSARLDCGAPQPDVHTFPVQPLLLRVAQTFGAAARKKNLRLVVVPGAASVSSDPAMLERIVSNLVANAICYTAKGGVLIACRAGRGVTRIEVYDTGVGIPAAFQGSVFDEFFRIKNPGRDNGGLGLGLSIVKGTAALLSHRIELASRSGRGSRFSVIL